MACRLLFVGSVRGLVATTLCVLGASVELVGPSLLVEGDVIASTYDVGTSRALETWPYTAPTSASPREPYVI